jgi:hypothetical protein
MTRQKIYEKGKNSMIEVDLDNISEASFRPSKSIPVCLGSMGPSDLEGE